MMDGDIYLIVGLFVLLLPTPMFVAECFRTWRCTKGAEDVHCAITKEHAEEHVSLSIIVAMITAASVVDSVLESSRSPLMLATYVLWATFVYGATLHFRAEREGELI